MIDPFNITKFNRTTAELQELLLFAVAVAGKTASIISKKIDEFLKPAGGTLPFNYLLKFDKHEILKELQKVRLGKYKILTQAYSCLAKSKLNLRECSVNDLEEVPGIGPKTSRFFLLHTRPNQNVACIDTHIKKWLNSLGIKCNNYAEYEQAFLLQAKLMKRDVASLDLEIWKRYARK